MARQSKAIISIPKIYRSETIHNLMFAYVMGVTDTVPTINRSTAINEFRLRFGLKEEDYPTESALTIYNRMFKNYQSK